MFESTLQSWFDDGIYVERKTSRRFCALAIFVEYKSVLHSDRSMLNDNFVSEKEPRLVTCRFRIPDIYQVDAASSIVNLGMNLHMFWKDETLIGKKKEEIDWSTVWKPDVEVLNSLDLQEETSFELTNSSSGAVRQKVKWRGQITMWMDLKDFPFDENDIIIQAKFAPRIFQIKKYYLRYLYHPYTVNVKTDNRLKPLEVVGYEAGVGLTDWLVGIPSVKVASQYRASNGTHTPTLEVNVPVKRLYEYYIVRVILILLLIVVMSWTTFSMDPSDFSGRLGINLTLFLAAVAFLFVIAEGLPKVPYLTFLDRFLTLSFLGLFFTVVENWISYMFHKNDRPEFAEKCDWIGAVAIPAVYLLCCLWLFERIRRKRKTRQRDYPDQKLMFQGRGLAKID